MSKTLPIRPELAWILVAVCAAAVLALAQSAALGFFALLFAAAAWWTWLNPLFAFYTLIVILPLLPMFKATQTVGLFTLIKDVFILTLFAQLFVWPLITQRLPYRRNILWLPLVALAAWVGFNLLRAPSRTLGILRAREIMLYVLLYFVVLYLPKVGQWFKPALAWFLSSAVVVGALGVYQLVFAPDSTVLRFDPAKQIWIPRMSSTLGHPSVLGHYLILVAALLAALLLTVKSKTAKIWAALGLAATAPLMYFTYSRAAWAGYVIALGLPFMLFMLSRLASRGRKFLSWQITLISVAAVILIVVIVLRFTSAGVFLKTVFDPKYASNADRIEYLTRLVAGISNTQALIGGGLGHVVTQNFGTVDLSGADIASGASRDIQLAKDATLVDNQYIKTFVEMGLAGLLIYFWIFWRLGQAAWQRIMVNPVDAITLWSLTFGAAFIIQAAFVDIWDVFPTNLAFWTLAALLSRTSK